jgi:uncharacterized integral membrane protein
VLAKLKKICVWTLALVVSVLFLFFAMVNREMVALELTPFPYTIEMRLFVFTGLLMLIGIFLGWVVASFECRRRYLVKKDVRLRMQALEDEVAALRARQNHAPATGNEAR